MSAKQPRKPVLLPNDEWVGGTFQLPGYVHDRKEPYRPLVGVWVDVGSRFIIACEAFPVGSPGSAMAGLLAQSINNPHHESYGVRPLRVRVSDLAAVDAVRALLGPGIEVVVGPVPELVEFERSFEKFQRSGTRQPAGPLDGYLKGGRIPPETVGVFFGSAADLWKVAPWDFIYDTQVIKVSVPSLGRPAGCVSVIGHAGNSFGIIFFDSLPDYAAYSRKAEEIMSKPRAKIRDLGAGCLSVNFDPEKRLNATQLSEIAGHGWKILGQEAHPVLWKVDRDAIQKPVSPEDYLLASVACRAVAQFTKKHGKAFSPEHHLPLPRSLSLDISLVKGEPPIPVTVSTPYM